MSEPLRQSVVLSIVVAVVGVSACPAFEPGFGEFEPPAVRPLRDRVAQRDAVLELRLDQLFLAAMRDHGLDCWIVVTERGNLDPLFSLLSLDGADPRGRAVLLLYDAAGGLNRLAMGEGLAANAGAYELVEPSQGEQLADLLYRRVADIDPVRIGINRSVDSPVADGLSASNEAWLRQALRQAYFQRTVSSASLVEDLLNRYLDIEAQLFAEVARLTVSLLEEVLSDEVLVAGGTSAADLAWAFRERANEWGLEIAFPPQAHVQRRGESFEDENLMGLDVILQPGDLVFLSAGLRYLGYASRYGRWVYLLEEGERQAPAWVAEGLAEMADALEEAGSLLVPGRTGDELETGLALQINSLGVDELMIGRVGYLLDRGFDLSHRGPPHILWRAEPPLHLASLVAAAVTKSFVEASWSDQHVWLALVEDVVIEETGARFVVPIQRTPFLIE